jgi:hypothetical protein
VIRLHSEASEAARRLFLRKDFVVTARRQFEISGIHIHNYAVEKHRGIKTQNRSVASDANPRDGSQRRFARHP